MASTAEGFRRIEPVVKKRPQGDYLAVSQPGSRLSIGVVGRSEEEARALFREEREAWAALSELPTT